MTNAEFWSIINFSRLRSGGSPERHAEILAEDLQNLDPDEIVAFDRLFSEYHLRAYSWDLWGAAYLIGGGCSDDGFMDFRTWLISRGEEVYQAVLTDPDSLSGLVRESDGDCRVEEFAYAATRAWEKKTGLPGDAFPEPRDSTGPLEETRGTEWTEKDLPARFPKLHQLAIALGRWS